MGSAQGSNRAVEAAKAAVNSPMLDVNIEGARGVLLNITGGTDMTLKEVQQAANVISNSVDPEANIIFGAVIDPAMKEQVKVTVIATEFDRESEAGRESHAAADGPAARRASPVHPAPRAAAINAPTPVDLKDYAARQEALETEPAADAAPSSSAVESAGDDADDVDGADAETTEGPDTVPVEDTPAAQAIAKARALSNVAITRRQTLDLLALPDPLAAAPSPDGNDSDGADPAADVQIDSDVDAGPDSVDDIPAFLQNERQA